MEQNEIDELIRERDYYKAKLDRMQRNNKLATYLVIQGQIDSFVEQLTIRMQEGKNGKMELYGYIDLFASKDAKEFDRAKWFFEEFLNLQLRQESLYKMLTDEEKQEADGKGKPIETTVTDWDAVRISIGKKMDTKKNGSQSRGADKN